MNETKTNKGLNFHPPRLSDACWVHAIVDSSDCNGEEACFASVYIYSADFDLQICKYRDFFLLAGIRDRSAMYDYPIGAGDIDDAIAALERDADSRNVPFLMGRLTENDVAALDKRQPGKFAFKPFRDDFNYIYDRAALAEMKGGKYHGKSGQIDRMLAAHPAIRVEDLTPGNLADAITVCEAWSAEHPDRTTANELDAINIAISSFSELRLAGIVVYDGDAPIAMTIGAPTGGDTMDVLFEKAPSSYPGAFPFVCREFARRLTCKYMNREEDMGIPGLRQSKMSYNPIYLRETHFATLVPTCRRAHPSDLDEMRIIFAECFPEDKAPGLSFDRNVITADNSFVACIGKHPVSLVACVPVTCDGKRGHYIFGVSTMPHFRGFGIASALMKFAIESRRAAGDAFSMLLPCDEAMYDFYGRIGFREIKARRVTLAPGERTDANCASAQFCGNFARYCAESALANGGRAIEQANGAICIGYIDGDTFAVSDYLPDAEGRVIAPDIAPATQLWIPAPDGDSRRGMWLPLADDATAAPFPNLCNI